MNLVKILDHGYLRHVESWGKGDAGSIESSEGTRTVEDYECGIIEAARQSTQASFRGWEEDEKLLKHLYSKKHMGPFEFAGMTIEIQAPILVFREWHRHRTQSYNEMSARYSPIPSEKYIPTMDRLMQVNEMGKNRQAGNVGGIQLSPENAMKWLSMLEHSYAVSQEAYRFGLSVGIAKELARCPMPVANYSRMRATGNLRNWLAFMTLRCDPDAQWEIRQFAQYVAGTIMVQFPRTYQRWAEAV
jgi:thymidylate synthase (FAD)